VTAGYIVTIFPFVESSAYHGPYARVPGQVPWPGDATVRDPFIFGDYYGDDGLIERYESAVSVRSIYSEIHSPESLEILWVSTEDDPTPPPESSRLIGIDVASPSSPFYSPVLDLSARKLWDFDQLGVALNQFGLLTSAEDARTFISRYRQLDAGVSEFDRERRLTSWRVYLVDSV
jgi:hypothetical protein